MEKKSIFPWRNFKEVEPTKEVTENSKQLEIDEKLQLANKNRVSSLINPNSIKNFVVKSVGYLTTQIYRRELFQRPEYNLAEIRDASESDSYIKIAFAKYSYLIFKAGWKIKGENQQAVDYIKKRFKVMSFCTGKPMDILFQELADDLTRYSNTILLKSRIDNIPGIKAKGVLSEQVVGGYFRVDPTSIRIKRDKFGNVLKYEQGRGENKKQFAKEDVIHMYYDEDANNAFGTPRVIAALDDVKLLRKIEGNVVALIHRFSMPLYQWKVGIPQVGFQGTDAEIRKAKREVESSSLDGLIITNEKTEIKAIGAEGHALNAEPYLRYFEDRVFSALGVSASQMGRGGAKQDADSMEAQIHDTVKYIQRVMSIWIKETMINELLLEGGFDIFDPANEVNFVFEEISLETKLKKENHEMLKYQSNVTTFEEARRKMGLRDNVDDEDRLYQRMINDKSSIDQIDRSGEWQERLAHINAAARASTSSSSSGSNSSTSTSSKRSRNTAKQKQPSKAVSSKNRPSNQYGTTSVKIKENLISLAKNILLEYIIDIKSENNDIETINDLYIKKATNLIEKEINYNSLKAINEATIQINSIQENYYLLPSQELDLSNLKNEVNQNISEIFKDISNSISNNNDDINNLLDLYILEFENLINLFSKTSYLYSFAKTGYLIGINEAYLISDESSTKINTKEINLNDILSTNYTNCLITYDKSEVIDNGNRT